MTPTRARGFVYLVVPIAFFIFLSAHLSAPRAAKAATPANISWTKFEDPNEKAFSADVPAGWTARGGAYRLGFSDVRSMIDVTSANGDTNIRLGDIAIPPYFLPNQFHHEGEVYDLGAQAQGIVAKYRTGGEYARLYALSRFTAFCKTLTPQPIDSAPAVQLATDQSPPGSSSEGQVEFRCDTAQGAKIAYVYAKTASAQGLWQVAALGSFLAPTAQADLARTILLHESQSFQIAPAWVNYQKNMDDQGLQYQRARQQQRLNALAQQVQQFEAKMQTMRDQVNSFERRQNAQAAQVESFDKTLVGVTSTTDPLDGTKRDVWTGTKSGYWINGNGTVVNSTDSPGPGWRPLQADSQ
jgi:hypothetical protein